MWLITTFGYFSIVKKQYQPNDPPFQVRARVEADLQKLNNLLGMEIPVITTYDSDYPYRILVDSTQLAQLFLLFAESIDYKNFKDEIFKDTEQRERLIAYHDVWSALQNL